MFFGKTDVQRLELVAPKGGGMVLKKNLWPPAHILNVLFCKKTGLRLVHFSVGEAVYKVPVDIGGSHFALCLVTQISERDRVQ